MIKLLFNNLFRKLFLISMTLMGKKISATLIIFSFACAVFAQHPNEQPKRIGTFSEFYQHIKVEPGQANARISKERSLPTNDATLSAIINVNKTENGAEVILGEIKGSKGSNVSFNISNGTLEGFAVMPGEEKAYKYSSDIQGSVYVTEVDIHEVMCINFTEPQDAAGTGGDALLAVPPTSSSVYKLQSLPSVTGVAYLDFDGEYVSGTRWNGGNPINALPGNFTETDITNIWKMVSEDYRPFNLNVTTDRAVFDAAPKTRRIMCIFTPTNTAAPGAGGVAYLNSFRWNDDTPCWVFNGGAKSGGEAGSHEIGHAFGLGHDGTPSTGYYSGHGIWAPIMGVGYSRGLSQWSRGEYANANNTQDDVAIIANTSNGIGYRADEAGNTAASAKALTIGSSGTVTGTQNYGIIATRTDVDVYSFTTGGGTVNLTASPSPTYPDLDILLTLTNASGTVLATANPTASAPSRQTGTNPITGLAATLSTSLSAGTYYLHVDGTGQGDPASTGYSDYASLGEYTISGTVPGSTGNQSPTVSITSPANNASFAAPAYITINANASDSDGSVSSVAFYNGSTLLSTDATSPYSFSWSNVAAGTYTITARATDNSGAISTSSAITVTVLGPCIPTAIIPYTQINGGSWTSSSSASLNVGGDVMFGPQPVTGGSWRWTGPNGFSATTREIHLTNIQTNQAGNYIATYTNGEGCNSTHTFSVTVIAPNIAPTVSITSPANNASFVAPASITINATASDSDGSVSSVAFYNGTTLLGTDATSPYSFAWSNVASGTYSITARATDNSGAITTSAVITVSVNTAVNQTPVVNITSPANNASYSAPANISINANASDPDGSIARVAFYRNGNVLLGEDLTSPYSFAWSNVAAGTYTLTAVATDNSGASTTSSIVTITVNPAVNQAPTVSITSPANNAVFSAPASITINATASDPDGSVSRVAFYNGTILLNTDVTSPYSFVWSNVGAGTYSLRAIATDNSGATTTSSTVSITVNEVFNQPPTVAITSPANNATYTAPANISINASASDSDGSVNSVAFYNGTTLLGTDATSPYNFVWSNVAAGTYALTARATDNSGSISTSSPVSVTVTQASTCGIPSALTVSDITTTSAVLNWSDEGASSYLVWWRAVGASWTNNRTVTDNNTTISGLQSNRQYEFTVRANCSGSNTAYATPYIRFTTASPNASPIVGISSPANNSNHNAPANITISANASDSDGSVSSVAFYNGSTLLGSDATSPYSFSWNNVAAGTYSLTAVATDNLGATTTSSVIAISVTLPSTCGIPSALAVSNTTTSSAVLSWSNEGASSYLVWWRVVGGSWSNNRTVTSNSTTITGLQAATQYEFTVRANCSGTNTAYATPYFRFSTTGNACGIPRALSASGITSGSATLNWSDEGASSYLVWWRVVGGSWNNNRTVTSNSTIITGLLGSREYEWTVRANCSGTNTAYATPYQRFTTAGSSVAFSSASESITFSVTNPFSDNLTLNFDNSATPYGDVQVFDSFGKEVVSLKNVESGGVIDMSGLSSGMYVLRFKAGEQVISRTIIKQ